MEVLKADSVSVKIGGRNILQDVSFTIKSGERWAITGPSGSGKTTLLKVVAGKVHHAGTVTLFENHADGKKIILVEQQHHFKNLSNTSNFYYQQRFNSSDSEDAITVEEDFQKVIDKNPVAANNLHKLIELFNIEKLLGERLIQLSNGENKRLQIVKALLFQPAILLLDNPFIGLDVQSRQTLEALIEQVTVEGIVVILTVSSSHLPRFVTDVFCLSNDGSYIISKATSFKASDTEEHVSADHDLLKQLTNHPQPAFDYAVRMKDVHIQYEGRKILDNINWEVRNGDRWSLSGPNGSGKSTLLSLINADNPQAYANDIHLFDRKRGTGETIWEIKKKIGFVSPELHLYFEKGITCQDVVASGLFDTIGLFRQLSSDQSHLVLKWMQLLQVEHLKNKFLFQVSNSEQRLVLLARALVKNPPMLILDEPCQGLDDEQVQLFKNLVNEICLTGNKTLIYVSHYAEEIPGCVTKFIRLENGKAVN